MSNNTQPSFELDEGPRYTCAHGHELTPMGLMRIQMLEREVASLKAKLADRHSTACDLVRSTADGHRCSCDAVHYSSMFAETQQGKIEATERNNPAMLATVRQLLVNDRLIAAIKAYRDAVQCGLKEAKDAVEQIDRDMRRTQLLGSIRA